MPFLEDLYVGQVLVTPGRTVYMHDITGFAELTGDWHELHTNAVFAAATVQGRTVAHGALVLSYAAGLLQRAGVLDDKAMAFLGVDWRISAPVFPEDTIWVHVEVLEVRRSVSKPDRGIVELDLAVRNQRDEVVATARWSNMFRSDGRHHPDAIAAGKPAVPGGA